MPDNYLIYSPAKVNLFLEILNKDSSGLHNIFTGITFVNLFDKIKVKKSNINKITYTGSYKPLSTRYDNDIIHKIIKLIDLESKNIQLDIKIEKNIPFKAGLGSASTNAASFIKVLEQMKILENVDKKFLLNIGSDVPACYYGKNCIVNGIGDKLYENIIFPKYYFILVKPDINFSTVDMYKKVEKYSIPDKQFDTKNSKFNASQIRKKRNDFAIIAKSENNILSKLLADLSFLEEARFSRMTGSGSCCYAVFEDRQSAINAMKNVKKRYPKYWIYFVENNKILN